MALADEYHEPVDQGKQLVDERPLPANRSLEVLHDDEHTVGQLWAPLPKSVAFTDDELAGVLVRLLPCGALGQD